ncbi:MAG: peptidylprolyl isomerase [Candidatus Marinimicrobia bacterium]|nr:peptidylprolyl isomerase [Candidatus Neomarinimicrobiota bacterium]
MSGNFLPRTLVLKALVAAMILVALHNCSDSSSELAAFDGGVVQTHEFLNHYQKYLTVTGLKDNLPDREKILRSVLHEKLILKNWQENALDDQPEVEEVLRRQEEQALLDALWQKRSSNTAQPDPKALAAMLVQERTRYHIQEAAFQDHASAVSMSKTWSGSQASIDYTDLGFLLLEDVHPRLMEKISKMKSGEVSDPIRMGQGYLLIKLVEKQFPPFIRPRDFAAAQERLHREWTVNQSDSIINSYTQEVLSRLDVDYSAEGTSVLLNLIATTSKASLRGHIAESNQSNLILCSTKEGDWTLEMLIPHLLDSRPEHLNSIIDKTDIQKLISGLLVRQSLIAEAREVGLHKQDLIREAIQKRQNLWRIKTWQERFADTVSIHQDYLKNLNQNELNNNSKIPRRNVEFFVFQDSGRAHRAYENLHTEDLSVKVTSDLNSRLELPSDGKMGWVTAEDLGFAAKLVFSQDLNTWTKPWYYGGEFFLFRSVEAKNDPVNVDLARENLELLVRSQGAPVQLEQALLAMEKSNHAIIYQDRIKQIPFIQLSGNVDES